MVMVQSKEKSLQRSLENKQRSGSSQLAVAAWRVTAVGGEGRLNECAGNGT